ncbi:helix-turn-helix transcriptional regulator [Actinoallomurus sp. WRP6H-15]|nr:helix-turn-helix transcriptional regulator [Actinoallomurus soli]MCO5973513.1 helix-turn-helix transcriptional regulator [Actinoallomurus soli]
MSVVRAPLNPKVSLWHMLAYLLRWEREKNGLSLVQWGKIASAAPSTVSNVEAGRRKIDERQAKILDRHFRTGGLFELLLWYAQNGHNPDWAQSITAYEAVAQIIRIYQGQYIPPPFQTEDYARALLQTSSDGKDLDETLKARMERQVTILDRPDPPYVWVLLDEDVLDDCIGGPEVMQAQLRHLLELMQRPNVSIRIIPRSAGAHIGKDGPFRIITVDSRDIAYAGAARGGRLIEMCGEVEQFRLDFDRIGQKAASEDASRFLIERRLEATEWRCSGARVPAAEGLTTRRASRWRR